MDTIMFRTTSLFSSSSFFFFFFLTTLPNSLSQPPLPPPPLQLPPPYFDICTEPYECGELKRIFYPFWGKDRPPQCGGGDQFKLHCDDHSNTTIQIGSQNFTVKNITMDDKIMRLVPTNLSNKLNICSLQSYNTYLNNLKPPLFGYRPSLYNIAIFYDCPPIHDFPPEHTFKCGPAFSYFGKKNEQPLKRFGNELGSCKRNLDVLSNAEFEPGMALTDLLNEGLNVSYKVDEGCAKCLGSEGDCWSDGFDKHIDSCYYCSDGSHDCYHHKSIKWSSLRLKFIVAGVLMGGFMICIIICLRKRKSYSSDRDIEAFLKDHGALAQRRYKYSELKKMTNSFKLKLGQGGFGAVYKGELLSGCPVAVKILNGSKENGEDFINEVASISRTSHVNIVTLLGFCIEGRRKALIYEFMPNGSLDKFVYNKGLKTTQSLSWDNLWQIAIGIARGLEYLHRGCNTRILHFDIKPHNILLDEKFCPKISDFGLAKLCPRNESIISMSDQRGTIGYVAPEVWNRHFGGISHKSDVYSYGMMLLEMVGGRNNINAEASNTSEIYFPDWIYNRLEQGGDLRPNGVIVAEENEIARRMTMVGLWCVQTFPKDRPTMSKVIDMLEGNMNSLELPPKPVLSSPPRLVVPESITSSSQFE